MNLRFASFTSVALAFSLMACMGATPDDDADSTSDEVVAGDACKLAKPKTDMMCITLYDPVCGCDGKTYGNSCEAGRFVTSSTPGECPPSDAGTCKLATPQDTACYEIYAPVCGCDGVTYGNDCEAERVVTSYTPGECPPANDGGACELPEPRTDVFCPQHLDPVCGCDGKTYGNACNASLYVTSSTPGECPDVDAGAACKLKKPKNTFCPAVYNPVCGCDGKTYGNSCEAARVVSSSTPGACDAKK